MTPLWFWDERWQPFVMAVWLACWFDVPMKEEDYDGVAVIGDRGI
jgi:hypothetical protein